MKPPPFDYYAPESLDDALALLREHGDDAKILAGGQSLIPLLALRLARPAVLVDIGKIASLRHVTASGSLVIGAGVTQRQCERDPAVARHVPLLHEALPHIAHPQIRNRGTVCGSVAHGDPAAELPAVMLALDATITILGEAGTRSVPAEQFFVSYLETAVAPDEILLDVRIPLAVGDRTVHAFAEISRRHGDFALAGAACTVDLDAAAHVRGVRLALFGVGSTPVRVHAAEASLLGGTLSAEAIADAAALAMQAVHPSDDVHASAAYRRHIAGVLIRRTLTTANERAGEDR